MTQSPTKHTLLLLAALLFTSSLAVAIWLVRFVYTGSLGFIFLQWNLFLAWLPVLFALLARRKGASRWGRWLWGGLWLLFFPNAPYLLTDLLHLGQIGRVPIWYDLIMLLTYALAGLFVGFASLFWLHDLVARTWNRVAGWLFVLVVLALSSFGVYIGRFLRWNSWDLVLNPTILLRDLADHLLVRSQFLETAVVTVLLTAVFIGTYFIIFALPPQMAVVREQ
ncbi:MAG: DUF1361 domain-containing protein [Ardenticatenaceae bacterium]|nr:DUF1361 domain-containing protein [Anaerolineales bacterium]MCB8942075.1 DUF1361 domain-containing protein [Ardenticatenaceae bacterium]MCB8973165.1 DUF1361 domain-containing protein [Ardenticatenaceae bacterium]